MLLTSSTLNSPCLVTRSLGLLVRKISDPKAEELIRSLCDKVILGKKEQQREIAAIGLKTVIKELHSGTTASAAAASITSKMLEGVKGSTVRRFSLCKLRNCSA